ncbi:hypothetical protein CFR73_16065 [Novacetimonas maltaceti]|nr:hypothetical protein CFR73_16065 [Novacetimonas maltaceti]
MIVLGGCRWINYPQLEVFWTRILNILNFFIKKREKIASSEDIAGREVMRHDQGIAGHVVQNKYCMIKIKPSGNIKQKVFYVLTN